MKFKSISIFLFLIDLVYGGQGPLTVEENQLRLKTCGKFGKNEYPHPWLWSIGLRGGNLTYFGTFISSRHFLTSSILFLQHTQPESLKESKCIGDETGILLTDPFEFNITQRNFQHFLISSRVILPLFCTNKTQLVIRNGHFSPMIVEFLEEQKPPFPCLGSANSLVAENWFLKPDFRRRTITFEIVDFFSKYYISDKPPSFGDKEKEIGGVLEQEIRGKVTVIGIKTAGDSTNNGRDIFCRMEWLEDSFCKLVGICMKEPEPHSSTKSPTTSEAPETSGTPSGTPETLEPSQTFPTYGTTESSEHPDSPEATETLDPSETTTQKPEATTVPPPVVPHWRTMPPEYIDNGDYDMIFDSLYEFPEFREIETPYEKKGCRRGFELVLVVLFLVLVYEM